MFSMILLLYFRFGSGGFGARDYRQMGRGGNKHPTVQQNFGGGGGAGGGGMNYGGGFQSNPGYGGSYGGAYNAPMQAAPQNDWWGN